MKKATILILASVFAFLVNVNAQAPQRKCGTMEYLAQQKAEDPTLEIKIENYEVAMQKWIDANQEYINNSKAIVTVPVVVHVVYNTTAQNISDARVLEQINILNRDYAGLNTGSMGSFSSSLKVNTDLQFCLAQRKPDGTATNGIDRKSTTVTSFSTNNYVKMSSKGGLDAWDATKYMNIWVCNLGGGLCGYAQFPTSGVNSTFGVVINYQYFGVTGAVAPYNLGGTTTHEIGHCFNLYHVWGDDNGACTGTDYCTDIPNQANSTYGVHTGVLTDACTSTSPGVQYMNFMDYSDDASYANFTPNQKARIAALFTSGGLLYSLSVSNGCTPPSTSSCGTPASLSASAITTTSATLTWGAISGATSYNIQYRKSGTTTFTTTTSTTASKAITGLTAASTYEFQVQAICSTTGVYSGLTTFTTLSSTTCTDIYESNNTVATAKTIAVNTNITALIGTSTDVDYFKFSNTSTKKNIKIVLSNLPADYDIKLYKSNGTTLVTTSQNSGTTSETITYNNAAAGTYYLKVYGYSSAYSATSCYTLNASISSTAYKGGDGEITESDTPALLSMFPNPAIDNVSIMYNSEKDASLSIKIIDMTGRIVYSGNYQAPKGLNSYAIDLSSFTNGLYMVAVENSGDVQIEKLLIQK